MQPKLEVVYNSQSGNGLLGQGWGLSGLSTITRCPRTQAQDGIRAGINFDGNDRFCLDGQRLILVSGTYGVAGSEYRTEIESFSKITAVGSAGTGPASFLVKTKSGLTKELGNTTDSRIEAIKAATGTSAWTTGTVRTWAQNKLSDIKGNYLTIAYTEDSATGVNGDGLPDIVGFGPTGVMVSLNTRTGFAAATSWIAQFGTAQGWTNNNVHPRQVIDVNGDGRSDIVGFGGSGVMVSLNTGTAFAPASNWIAQFGVSVGGWSDNYTYPRQIVDVNGDGLPDIVGFSGSGVMVSLNTGTAFATATNWNSTFSTASGWTNNNTHPRQLVDMNGDGLPDVVGFASGGVSVALNTGSRFETASNVPANYSCSGGTLIGSTCSVPATPIIGCPSGASTYYDGDGQTVCYYGSQNSPKFGQSVLGYSCSSGTLQGSTCMLAANYSCPLGYALSGSTCVLSASGGGNSGAWTLAQFGVAQGWTDNNIHPRQVVDINGDGLPDVVGFGPSGVMVSISTGTAFVTAANWIAQFGTTAGGWTDNNVQPRQLVDVNADGLPDVVGFGPAGVMVALNTGTSFATASSWISGFGTTVGWTNNTSFPRQVVDVTGDGVPDVLGFFSSGVSVASNQQDVLPGYVTKVTDGLGAYKAMTYVPLTVGDIYTKDSGSNAAAFPRQDFIAPLYVLSVVGSSSGIGGLTTVAHSYGGLKVELGTGRGMLGFRWVSSRDTSTNVETYSEFRQDFPFLGMPSKTEQRLSGAGNGGVLKRNTSTLECKTPASGSACAISQRCDLSVNSTACVNAAHARYFRYVASTKEETWDLNGAAYPTSSMAAEYGVDTSDGKLYGDATQVSMSTSDGASKTTLYEYWPADTGNWILGRLKKSALTSTVPGTANAGSGGSYLAPTITASQGPSPWVGNQPATLSWSSTNTTLVSYSCTAAGTGFNASETEWPNGTSASVTASESWVAYPSTCVFTAAGPGGTATYNLTVSTVPEPVFNFTPTIASNTLNYNLRAAAVSAGWDGTSTQRKAC